MGKFAAAGVVTTSLVLAALGAPRFVGPDRDSPSAAYLEEAPLTIAASTVGWFAGVFPWHLSVNSAGQAELTIDTYRERTRRRFDLRRGQLDEFRKVLAQERFFDLPAEHGELVYDGSLQTLTVTAGTYSNSIRVRYLRVPFSRLEKLSEPARAVRLLVLIRGWFDDAKAVDLRPLDTVR